MKKRFIPEKLFHVHVAVKLKFVLEQPSGTGVGHELTRTARSGTCYGKLTHKDTFMSMTTLTLH